MVFICSPKRHWVSTFHCSALNFLHLKNTNLSRFNEKETKHQEKCLFLNLIRDFINFTFFTVTKRVTQFPDAYFSSSLFFLAGKTKRFSNTYFHKRPYHKYRSLIYSEPFWRLCVHPAAAPPSLSGEELMARNSIYWQALKQKTYCRASHANLYSLVSKLDCYHHGWKRGGECFSVVPPTCVWDGFSCCMCDFFLSFFAWIKFMFSTCLQSSNSLVLNLVSPSIQSNLKIESNLKKRTFSLSLPT